jgi:hypothetical protein
MPVTVGAYPNPEGDASGEPHGRRRFYAPVSTFIVLQVELHGSLS